MQLCLSPSRLQLADMKKFLNKLENKLDGKSSSSSSTSTTSSPNRPQQQQQQYAVPSGPPRPQQYPSYQQQQQYAQQGQATTVPQGTFAPPSLPPPGGQQQQAGGYATAPVAQVAGREDPFAALRRYDTVFIVDDSESSKCDRMLPRNQADDHYSLFASHSGDALGCNTRCTRRRRAESGCVAHISVFDYPAHSPLSIVQYDSDGCDIYFFNSQVVVENLRTAQDVRSIFNRVDPRKSTPTARALARVLEPYLKRLEAAHRAKETGGQAEVVKPLNVVILTGELDFRGDEKYC